MEYWLQYKSIDGGWHDNTPFVTLDEAMRHFEMQVIARPGYAQRHRIIQRTDKVVYPVPIDPAIMGGA